MRTMASTSKVRSSGPIGKTIKCKVLFCDNPTEYQSKDGESKKVLNAACSDGYKCMKLLCYDTTKFKYIKEGQSLVLRQPIERADDGIDTLVITSSTKVFITSNLEVPDDHGQKCRHILNPPPAGTISVQAALSSPIKQRVSISGKVIQEEDVKYVKVKGEDVPIKSIKVKDNTGEVSVTLWRNLASVEARPGQHILVTDVVPNVFNKQTSLSSTYRSKIEKCEAPAHTLDVLVEGINVDQGTVELFCGEEDVTVPQELLQMAIATEDNLSPDIESVISMSLKISYKGGEVTSIEKN